MRYLGLDVGDRNIGVALSDETATLASGLQTLRRVGPRKDLKALAELVRRHGAGEVVVGLPRRLDGSLGPQAQKVLAFIDELRPAVRVPVVPWDERFTTAMAQEALIAGGAVMHFGADGLPEKFSADRPREVNGSFVRTPWRALSRDYREVIGMLVPFEVEAVWTLDTGEFPCARFVVEAIQHEVGAESTTSRERYGISTAAPETVPRRRSSIARRASASG